MHGSRGCGVNGMTRTVIGGNRLLCVLAVAAFIVPAWAQVREGHAENGSDSSHSHLGYPEDWSSRHLVISGERASDPLSAGFREPRHVYNRVMRENARARERESEREWDDRRRRRSRRAIHVDWAVSLDNGF